MSEWTKQWPQSPGVYWFYGVRFRDDGLGPKHRLVTVHKGANSMAYVTDGTFLYQAEGADGWWMPAELPEPPEEREL